ncbi:ABC transporter substrate-binding protein [Paramixta manurensis]|uniref:ABC transporter substrate-binding protein n=1 Tax=Paramixta manurensis TaxID=2740817 RepID=A0A6M8UD40_9GAMM|nr:ABC transporter substrate-binding protein [Erwiniaceae bacterium PD-1]
MKTLFLSLWLSFVCGLAHAQERVVVIGGSLTEIVYALGAGERVVGVDETSLYPPPTEALPHVGIWKQLSVESVLSLRPTLLITWQDAEPRQALDTLAGLGVRVVTLPRTPATPDRLLENIRTVAEALALRPRGEALAADIEQRLAQVAQRIATVKTPVRVLFLLAPGGGSAQVAGTESVADGILRLAGGHNVASQKQYASWGGEAMIAADPQVIVVTQQSPQTAALDSLPGIRHTSAWRNGRIVSIDQALILGMGPRVADAVEQLNQRFYPTFRD